MVPFYAKIYSFIQKIKDEWEMRVLQLQAQKWEKVKHI